MFNTEFLKSWPQWLRGSSGGRLELDGYNERLGIAFEYQGIQHFGARANDHRLSVGISDGIILRDAEKRRLCWARGVKLIVIPEVTRLHDLDKFLNQVELAILNAGVKIPRSWRANRPTNISDLDAMAGSPIFDKIRTKAADRGGECLSTVYLSSKHDLQWRCSRGHTWSARWNNIDSGTWCGVCALEDRICGVDIKTEAETLALCESIKADWLRTDISTKLLLGRVGLTRKVVIRRIGLRRPNFPVPVP